MSRTERADLLLVAQGLAQSRTRAQALILAGKVFQGERRIDKAGQRVPTDLPLEVRGVLPYVSRGGFKLAGALDAFEFDVAGKTCADFGASTGGFTDVLLQRGARKVYAIDVGYGQLHSKLRADERVVQIDRQNARHLTSEDLPELVELVVIDCSFIGMDKLLPAAVSVGAATMDILGMVKPQFQLSREEVGAGGVVRDPVLRKRAVDHVIAAAADLGLVHRGSADSPIQGPKGNQETFLWLRTAPQSI